MHAVPPTPGGKKILCTPLTLYSVKVPHCQFREAEQLENTSKLLCVAHGKEPRTNVFF